MKFIFAEKKAAMPDELKAYAEKKIGKLDRYFRTDSDTHITYSTERGKHTLEVTVHHDNMFFRAKEASTDIFPLVDSAVTTIERQIHKNKTRLEKRLRQGAFERGYAGAAESAASVHEEKDFNIIRTKRFSLKPMTPEEAILQMNLLNHEFFVFKNFLDRESFSVVYRRKDGGYGLIEGE